MSGIRSYVSGMSLMLTAVAVLLAALLYSQWNKDIATQYPSAGEAGKGASGEYELTSVERFDPVAFARLGETVERPLFTEGRLPPEKPKPGANGKSKVSPLKLKLEGVVISPESKVAIITDLQSRELLRLAQGMSHSNWKVTEVSEGSVTIQQGVKEITLILEIDESPGVKGKPSKVPFKLPPRPKTRR